MAFDATDPAPLERFFRDLPAKIDHVMVTAGRPHYGRLVDLDFAQARRALGTWIARRRRYTRPLTRRAEAGRRSMWRMTRTGGALASVYVVSLGDRLSVRSTPSAISPTA